MQGSGPAPQAAPDLIKETTHPDVREGRYRGVKAPAGADRLLGRHGAALAASSRRSSKRWFVQPKARSSLVKMNIDEHPTIPGQMGIQSIPAVIAFVNGQPADGFMGAVPESQVTAFINKLTASMPGEPNVAEILKEAETVLAEGGSRHRRVDLCRGAGGRRHQYRSAGGARKMLRRDRRYRTGQADAGPWCRIEARRCGGQGRAGNRLILPSRPRRSVR